MSALQNFNPNDIGLLNNNIFGLPFGPEDAGIILVPVPWEVTVSYRTGTAYAPEQIFDASLQVDLYDPDVPGVWQKGYAMLEVEETLLELNEELREKSEQILDFLANGGEIAKDEEIASFQAEINKGCQYMVDHVYAQTKMYLALGKKVGLIGGDHSTPLGYIKALAEVYGNFGILQIDAHADLRIAYEGFTYSHASIMYNVLQQVPQVSRLVQAGIRDYCDEELEIIQQSNGRIQTFFEQNLREQQFRGNTWQQLCQDIIAMLPQQVYISFDIDGLDPKLCPDTGTPVPGGFEVSEVFYLLKLLHESGRKVIGFDLNEVSNGVAEEDTINTITGARILYKLCNYLAAGD